MQCPKPPPPPPKKIRWQVLCGCVPSALLRVPFMEAAPPAPRSHRGARIEAPLAQQRGQSAGERPLQNHKNAIDSPLAAPATIEASRTSSDCIRTVPHASYDAEGAWFACPITWSPAGLLVWELRVCAILPDPWRQIQHGGRTAPHSRSSTAAALRHISVKATAAPTLVVPVAWCYHHGIRFLFAIGCGW